MDSDRGKNTGMDKQVTGTGINEDIRYKCGHLGTGMDMQVVHAGMTMDLWTRI